MRGGEDEAVDRVREGSVRKICTEFPLANVFNDKYIKHFRFEVINLNRNTG